MAIYFAAGFAFEIDEIFLGIFSVFDKFSASFSQLRISFR